MSRQFVWPRSGTCLSYFLDLDKGSYLPYLIVGNYIMIVEVRLGGETFMDCSPSRFSLYTVRSRKTLPRATRGLGWNRRSL